MSYYIINSDYQPFLDVVKVRQLIPCFENMSIYVNGVAQDPSEPATQVGGRFVGDIDLPERAL